MLLIATTTADATESMRINGLKKVTVVVELVQIESDVIEYDADLRIFA